MLNESRLSSDYIYYRDFSTTQPWGTVRYRLQCHLPETPNADNSYVYLLDYTNEPLWNGVPDEGSMWKQLPEDFVMSHQTGRAAYDKLPCGWPETPTLTLRLDLASLRRRYQEEITPFSFEASVAADHWLVLASYMTNPVQYYTTDPTGIQGLTSVYWAGNTVPYAPIYPVWTLKSDNGTGGDLDTIVFQGTQRGLPSATLDLRKNDPRSEITIECVHILRTLFESVPPEVFAWVFYYTQGTNYMPTTSADGWTMTAYDYLYADADATDDKYARLSCDYDNGDDPPNDVDLGWRSVMRLFDIGLIPYVTSVLLTEAYGYMLRMELDINDGVGVRFGNTYSHDTLFTTPLDHIEFARQDYTSDNYRGDLLWRSAEPWEQSQPGSALRFPGFFTLHGTTGETDYWDTVTGGFLSSADDRGLFQFKNLWDFYKTWASGTAVKVQFLTPDYDTLRISYSKLAEAENTVDIDTGSDLLPQKGGAGEPDLTLEIGGRVITGATIAVQGVWGEDVSAVTWKGTARVEREEDYGGTLVFHNHASVIDDANRYMQTFEDGAPEFNPDIPDSYDNEALVSAHTTHSCTKLYYDDYGIVPLPGEFNPPIVDTEVPIRPHDMVEVLTGFTVTGDSFNADGVGRGPRTPLPVNAADSIAVVWSLRDLFDAAWHVPLMETIKGIQLRAGMAYSIARTMTEVYGRENQYVVTLTLPLTIANYSNLGDIYRLLTGAGYGINAYLGSSSLTFRYLGNLPSKMHLTEIEPNITEGTATCTFVGLADNIRYDLEGDE